MGMILETILKWAVTFILGTIIGFVSSQFKKEKRKNTAIENAVQSLLRNELIRRYREYEIKGEISILDKENVEHMFEEYRNLGGNGTVAKMYEDLLELPTKIIRE